MPWAKVDKPFGKPLKFWYHKIVAELSYEFNYTDYYYHHLQQLIKLGYNLYGEKIR